MAYVGQRMSERAMEAYEMGEKPFSKWTKSEILRGLSALEISAEAIENAKTLTADELRQVALARTSWHHTGKYFAETDFYSIDETLENSDVLAWEHVKKEKKEKEVQIIMARVVFTLWEGQGRHRHSERYEGLAVWIEKNGKEGLATVAASATETYKKRVDGLDVRERFERLPTARTKSTRGLPVHSFARLVAEARKEAKAKK